MHTPGLIPLLIILVLAFLLFGRPGRLSGAMEALGKGIRGFRKGLSDPEPAAKDKEEPPKQIRDQTGVKDSSTTNNKTEA